MASSKDFQDLSYLSEELRIVVIGKTGSGKSSTANTLLGKDAFPKEILSDSVMRKTSSQFTSHNNRDLLVVDTPGLFDTNISNEDMEVEIATSVALAAPGLHAVMLVTDTDRFKEQDVENVEKFMKYFKKDLGKYLIVVFTGKDKLEKKNMELLDFIKTCNSSFQTLLKECNNRYLSVNNLGSTEEKREFTNKLVDLIDKTVLDNDNKMYTNDALEKAEKEMKQIEQEINAELEKVEEEELEQEQGDLETDSEPRRKKRKTETADDKKQKERKSRNEARERVRNRIEVLKIIGQVVIAILAIVAIAL